jgi:hypothetical protein
MTHPLSSLSSTQLSVVRTVYRYGQVSSSQLRRLHYIGTPRGTIVRSSRHLKALSERGAIKRLPYKLSGEYVYTAPDSKARIPNLHTLDITELYVRLVEECVRRNLPGSLTFTPEPWSHDTWGGVLLKADAYVKVAGRHFAAEIDRGTEFASALSAQMNKYVAAYHGMDGGSFPQVIFLAHDADRVRFIQRQADKKRVQGLFEARLFDDAVELMLVAPGAAQRLAR